jgi:hypothetical protein
MCPVFSSAPGDLASPLQKHREAFKYVFPHFILQNKVVEKEKAVVELVFHGRTFKETAKELGISESSVKTYMKRVYEKMGLWRSLPVHPAEIKAVEVKRWTRSALRPFALSASTPYSVRPEHVEKRSAQACRRAKGLTAPDRLCPPYFCLKWQENGFFGWCFCRGNPA